MGHMAVPFDAGRGAAFFAAGDDRDAGIEVGFAAFGGEGATRSRRAVFAPDEFEEDDGIGG